MKMKKKLKTFVNNNYEWSLWAKNIDSSKFFREISLLLDFCNTVFIEGTGISDEAEKIYKKYSRAGDYLPAQGVIWPKSKTYVCGATKQFWRELEDLSESTPYPDLFDHFFIYSNQTKILEWYDSFVDPISLSSNIEESEVYGFAAKLGLKVERIITGIM